MLKVPPKELLKPARLRQKVPPREQLLNTVVMVVPSSLRVALLVVSFSTLRQGVTTRQFFLANDVAEASTTAAMCSPQVSAVVSIPCKNAKGDKLARINLG